MSDLMNFKKGGSQPSGFSRASGRTLSAEKSNPVMDGKYDAAYDKPKDPIKDNCRVIGAELQRAKENVINLSRVNGALNLQLSRLSANFTIPSGTSYIGYSGVSGVSFTNALSQAYVSGGGGYDTALDNLFVKASSGKFYWGKYNFDSLSLISRGEGFFVRNFGSAVTVDWSRVK